MKGEQPNAGYSKVVNLPSVPKKNATPQSSGISTNPRFLIKDTPHLSSRPVAYTSAEM